MEKEGSRSPELPRSTQVAERLKARAEAGKPQIESARGETAILQSRAQQFLAQSTPDNLRTFIQPFLDRNDTLPRANSQVRDLTYMWELETRGEVQVSSLLLDTGVLPLTYGNLKKAVEALERQQADLKNGRLSRIFRKRRINTIGHQLALAKEYLGMYEESIKPTEDEVAGMNQSVDSTVDAVEARLKEVAEESRQREPEQTEQEAAKEEVLDQLEERWLEKSVVTPFKKIEDLFIAKRKREDGYTDMDEAMDRSNFAHFRDEYAAFVRSRIDAKPRTAEEWEATINEWADQETEAYDSIGPFAVMHRNRFAQTFIELGIEAQYFDFIHGLNLYSQDVRNFMYRRHVYLPAGDQLVDLRIRKDYLRWVKLLANYQPATPAWDLSELQWASYRNDHLLRLWNAVSTIPKRMVDRRDDLFALSSDELTSLSSYDRWLTLKDYLQEKRLVSQERLEGFEKAIIRRLVGDVLIPGGHESWPGTAAVGALQQLRSPAALEPLL